MPYWCDVWNDSSKKSFTFTSCPRIYFIFFKFYFLHEPVIIHFLLNLMHSSINGLVVSFEVKANLYTHTVVYLHCKFTFYNSYLHFCEKLTMIMVFSIFHYFFKTHLCPFIYTIVLSSYKVNAYLNMDEPVKF